MPINKMQPELDRIVSSDQAIEELGSGSGGIWIIDPAGKHLGTIEHGQPATTNLAWGGDDWKTLFFTSRNTLGSVQMKIAGLPAPAAG